MSQLSPVSPASQGRRPPAPHDLARSNRIAAVVIAVLAIVLGVVAGRFNPLLNHSTAAEGAQVDALFGVLLGVATTVFVIVQGGLLYSIVRFRRTSEDDDEDAPAVRGHVGLEILWTAVPAAIVTALALYSYTTLSAIEAPHPDAITVEVTARQFAWDFYYPDRDVHSAQLNVPRGQQVHLVLRSADVIHAFWVPDFRIKKDAMPDRTTDLRFTADKVGTFPIVCSRLCGVGHAFMRSNVIVQEPDQFQSWLYQQQTGASVPAGGQNGNAGNQAAVAGRQVFEKYGCSGCHTLKDANAQGQVGPDLDGIGTKAATRVAGESAEQYIHESIVKPNAFIVPGFQPNIMPQDFGQRISAAELQTLVQYLMSQK